MIPTAAEFREHLTEEDQQHRTDLTRRERAEARLRWEHQHGRQVEYTPAVSPLPMFTDACGTYTGYNRHRKAGTLERAWECGCLEAKRQHDREKYGYKPRRWAACGTRRGYDQHQRDGTLDLIDELGCGCRKAHADKERRRRRKIREAALV